MSARSWSRPGQEDGSPTGSERRIGDENRHGYDGTDRRSWQSEADILHSKLESIEMLARDTQSLARATNDSMLSHIAEERGTKAAIDELILLWRGSKMMVTAFKFIIPIVAALFGAAMWAREHFK